MHQEALFGKTLEELKAVVSDLNLPSYTAGQIADWLYKKSVSSIDEMTNISKQSRELLKKNFSLELLPHHDVQISTDGTKKYLFPTLNNNFVESAYIPEKKRNTLCISSQVGCRMGCKFCMTAKQKFQGNLLAGEILNQIRSLPEKENLTNIVYMGMGEPLDNLDEVLKSLQILTSEWGFGMSPSRITVSTIGILPAIKRFLKESNCHLAISMHTPFTEERKKLLPAENAHPLKDILNYLKNIEPGRRRISFEYIMFKGFNDTPRHVNELASILNGIKCRINLIRFHPVPDCDLTGSDSDTIENFMQMLNAKGIITTLRRSRGLDIAAACGLLSTKENSK